MALPLTQEAAYALRRPLPLDDPQFLDARRAFFRLQAVRAHLQAALRQAAETLVRYEVADVARMQLEMVEDVFKEVIPALLGHGDGPVASRLARVCLQVEESGHEFAACLSAAAETYELYREELQRTAELRPHGAA
jgi:hypothetical protein